MGVRAGAPCEQTRNRLAFEGLIGQDQDTDVAQLCVDYIVASSGFRAVPMELRIYQPTGKR